MGNVQRGVFPPSLYLYLTYTKNEKHKQLTAYRTSIAHIRKFRLFSAKTYIEKSVDIAMLSNNDPLSAQGLLLPIKIFNENKIGKAHEYNSMSAWAGFPAQCPSSSGKRDFKQELCKNQFPLCMKDSVSYNLIMV